MSITNNGTFNPVTMPQGSFPTGLTGTCGTIYVINESLETLFLTRDDSTFVGIIPGLWALPVVISFPPPSLNYNAVASQNAQDTTLQTVYVLGYSAEEDTSKLYSGPLPRIANVGNPTSVASTTTVSNVTNIQNDGNAAGSSIIETTVAGQTASNQTATNDGLWKLSSIIAGVIVTWLQSFAPGAAGTILQLGAASYLTELLGDALIDSNLTIKGTTEFDGQINSGAANNLQLNATTGHSIILKNNGTNIVTIDGSNVSLNGAFGFSIGASGVYRFRTGTMQGISNFTGSGSGTYSHNFGTSPFMVVPIVDVAGSATQGYDTITTTTVHITLGAAIGFRAWCWA